MQALRLRGSAAAACGGAKCAASQACEAFVWRHDTEQCWFRATADEFHVDPKASCYALTWRWCRDPKWLRHLLAHHMREIRKTGMERCVRVL